MEINKKTLDMARVESYIRTFDNIFPENTLKVFLKLCENHFIYEDAGVVNNGETIIDKEMRNVKRKGLHNVHDKSLTNSHWCALLYSYFMERIKVYTTDFNLNKLKPIVTDIQVLKYTPGGHYGFHVDDGPTTPRTLSLIYFVNDNYKGGDLVFRAVGTDNIIKIERNKNRLVVWPSNFIYPHSVTPVDEGTRYSVVAWAK
tara:strand:- start:1485 stop:2087 length:603 start_codon:yes stop_codon:yes gene_type:complete